MYSSHITIIKSSENAIVCLACEFIVTQKTKTKTHFRMYIVHCHYTIVVMDESLSILSRFYLYFSFSKLKLKLLFFRRHRSLVAPTSILIHSHVSYDQCYYRRRWKSTWQLHFSFHSKILSKIIDARTNLFRQQSTAYTACISATQ